MMPFAFWALLAIGAQAKERLPPGPKLESRQERAARLWQAGVFALEKGDYAWASKEFAECLKADPTSEDCKKGAADAADQAAEQPEHPRKTAKRKAAKRSRSKHRRPAPQDS